MPDNNKHITLYERRVNLVADTLSQHSELPEEKTHELAVHVLHAIDYIPEKLR